MTSVTIVTNEFKVYSINYKQTMTLGGRSICDHSMNALQQHWRLKVQGVY